MPGDKQALRRHPGNQAGDTDFATGSLRVLSYVRPGKLFTANLDLIVSNDQHRNCFRRGKRAITSDTALRLARVLGMSADFWLGLQLDWDLWHAMHSSRATEIAQLTPLRTTA